MVTNLRPQRQQGIVLVMTLVILVVITLASAAMMASLRSGISASANISFRQAASRSADIALTDALGQVNAQIAPLATALDANSGGGAAIRYAASLSSVPVGCSKSTALTLSAATALATAAATAGQWTHEACWNSTTQQYATPLDATALGWTDANTQCTPVFTPQDYRFNDSSLAAVNGSDGAACATKFGSAPSGYSLFYVVHRMARTTGSCLAVATGCSTASTTSDTGCKPGQSCDADSPVTNTINSSVYYRVTVKVAGPRQNNRYIQGFVY
jgi:Tfp pilus assembly protein PilX